MITLFIYSTEQQEGFFWWGFSSAWTFDEETSDTGDETDTEEKFWTVSFIFKLNSKHKSCDSFQSFLWQLKTTNF